MSACVRACVCVCWKEARKLLKGALELYDSVMKVLHFGRAADRLQLCSQSGQPPDHITRPNRLSASDLARGRPFSVLTVQVLKICKTTRTGPQDTLLTPDFTRPR